jgi:hypothetical protein
VDQATSRVGVLLLQNMIHEYIAILSITIMALLLDHQSSGNKSANGIRKYLNLNYHSETCLFFLTQNKIMDGVCMDVSYGRLLRSK